MYLNEQEDYDGLNKHVAHIFFAECRKVNQLTSQAEILDADKVAAASN